MGGNNPKIQESARPLAVKKPPFPRPAQPRHRWIKRTILATFAVLGLTTAVMLGLVFHWCNQPPIFDVFAKIPAQARVEDGRPVAGAALVATSITLGETLLDKPGGFLHNDKFPPGSLLDNCPNWECGVLTALRDSVRALRNDFSRTQSQSLEHPALKQADMQFSIDPKSWALPAAEDEYRKGIESLREYLASLSEKRLSQGGFHARADNLAAYLAVIEKRLGHQGSRLSASVADPALSPLFSEAQINNSSDLMSASTPTRTPANEVDDVFYCTRGYSWALLHLMQAIEIDFRDVLAAKNAQPLVQQIIRDLRAAIRPMSSPIILNGDGYGL
ncbi:MAG: DUF2333 family protein, partial [Chromatiaceae bacterium]|nr:DUF2333 family protein [Chromatiaceae bacterium]